MKRSATVALVALSFSVLLSGVALAFEVGHISESFQETMYENVSLSSGSAEPLPSSDPLIGQPISVDGSWTVLGAFSADTSQDVLSGVLSDDTGATQLLAYNFSTEVWDIAPTLSIPIEAAASGSFSFSIEDNGPYDEQWQTSGDITAYFMAVKPYKTPCSGGGGGGCSGAFLAPAAIFLLAPLFLLKKRG